MWYRQTFSVCIALAMQVNITFAASKCYDTRGVESDNIPCNTSAAVSACCGRTFVCLSNGLCAPGPDTAAAGYQTITDFYRGSCSDPTWEDEKCPNFCLSAEDSSGGQGLNSCSGVGNYCCWRSNGDCCGNSTAIINLGVANIQNTIGVTGTSTVRPGTVDSAGYSMATSSTISSPVLTSTSTGTSITVSQAPTSSKVLPFSTTSNSSTAPSNIPPAKNSTLAIGAGIGAGLGIPLVIAVIAVIILYQRRRKDSFPEHSPDHHPLYNHHTAEPKGFSGATVVEELESSTQHEAESRERYEMGVRERYELEAERKMVPRELDTGKATR